MYPNSLHSPLLDVAERSATARRTLEQLHQAWDKAERPALADFDHPLIQGRRLPRSTPLILGGAGQAFAGNFIGSAREHHLSVLAVVDNYSVGTELHGYTVQHDQVVAELARQNPNAVFVGLAMSPAGIRYFEVLARRHGLRHLSLWAALRAFDFLSTHFSGDYLGEKTMQNLEGILTASGLYADEFSRYTAFQVLLYRITFAREFITPVCIGAESLITCTGLLNFHDQEVFVDGGAFTGDSITKFLKAAGGWYQHIYAFEPDAANFPKLQSFAASKPNISALPLGLGERRETIRFKALASKGSYIDADGETAIEVAPLDEVIERTPTFIKLNIEGAEISALNGAKASIRKGRPKMAISIDHLGDDLITIPRWIAEQDLDYEIFIRHHCLEYFGAYLYARPRQSR